MRDNDRLEKFVASLNVEPFAKPPPLARPNEVHFIRTDDRDAAQAQLLEHRKTSQQWKDPSKGIRASVGIRSRTDIDKINATFTLNERREVFDRLLQSRGSVGIAQAVMDFHLQEQFDVEIRHQEKKKGLLGSKRGAGAADHETTPSRWLQTAAEMGQTDFVSLLASRNPRQSSLDEALKAALARGESSRAIVKELLRYEANPNTCRDQFQKLVEFGDDGTTGLLLNSPTHPLDQAERDKALLTAVGHQHFLIASQLLAFGANASHAWGEAFVSAVRHQDLKLLTLLISASAGILTQSLQQAVDQVCMAVKLNPQDSAWHDFLDLLLCAGAVIRPNNLPDLLRPLLYAREANVLWLLVKHNQISSEHATTALGQLPSDLPEDEAIGISNVLFQARANAQNLGAVLFWALENEYRGMVALLVEHGVSLDFDEAVAVRWALGKQDITLLRLLLNVDGTPPRTSTHTPAVLATCLPHALAIQSKVDRHLAVELLLRKRVTGHDLDRALLDVCTNPDIRDLRLIRTLLEGGASPNFIADDRTCIVAAAIDSDLAVLDLVSTPCFGPTSQNLSAAFYHLYESREKSLHAKVVESMRSLLARGAESSGEFVARTMVDAIQNADDEEAAEIAILLVDSGADINFNRGQPIKEALQLSGGRVLAAICQPDRSINRASFAAALPLAIAKSRGDQSKARVLLNGRSSFQDVISHALIEEIQNKAACQAEIINLLLDYGASVDYENGQLLASTASAGNVLLLKTLMLHHPEKGTIERAFKSCCHAQIDPQGKIEIFQILLNSQKISEESVTYALTHAVAQGVTDPNLLGLLCKHRATLGLEALSSLIKRRDFATAQFLCASRPPTIQVRSRGFELCLDHERPARLFFAKLLITAGIETVTWRAALVRAVVDRDCELLVLLLRHGVGQNVGAEAENIFVSAVETLDLGVVGNLLKCNPTSNAKDAAFERIVFSGRAERIEELRMVAALLLANGISQPLMDQALIQCLQTYRTNKADFYLTLLKSGADVNCKSCTCFYLAGNLDELDVFQDLLEYDANFDILVQSLVHNFSRDMGDRLVELLRLVFSSDHYRMTEMPNVKVLFEAMLRFPERDDLVRLLLEHDYPAGDTTICISGRSGSEEAVTPIIWALEDPRRGVGEKVIRALLDQGKKATVIAKYSKARPSFSTVHGVSAVSLAAEFGRSQLLEKLLKLGAEPSARDSSGKSPLFYATYRGDYKSVQLLLNYGADCNDGSLHEAARLCDAEIVTLLLEGGHDPDFPSDLHDGRTALGELCFRASPAGGEQESRAYTTMKKLIMFPTDLSLRLEGKTVLHLALENDQPVEVTRTLLRFEEVYKDIRSHSDTFLFEDTRGISMSPDRYVMQYCSCSDTLKGTLVDMLRKKLCKEKWFKKKGPQLPDATGLPPGMQEAMDQQDLADQNELREMERNRLRAQKELETEQARHAARLKQAKETTEQSVINSQRIHDQQLAHNAAVASQRRQQRQLEQSDELTHLGRRAEVELAASQKQKALEFESQKQIDQQRHVVLEREAALERRLLESREAAEQRGHERTMARFRRQDESIALAAREQRVLIEAAKVDRVNTNQNLLALTYPNNPEEVD